MLEFFITLIDGATKESLRIDEAFLFQTFGSLRIDKPSLLETFDSLKTTNFGYTPSCLQLLRKLMSNFISLFLYSHFSYFRKSLNCNISIFPCNVVTDIYNFS